MRISDWSSDLCSSDLQKYCQKYRVDEQGRARFAVIQAEDEIASIGMVVGAGWNGARAFTTTAGPGVSLMNEFIGLAYFAEVRSEEHTSELTSLMRISYAVFCLKKKKKQ